jgi:hypothetical protein
MADRGLADEEPLGDGLVLQAEADQGHDTMLQNDAERAVPEHRREPRLVVVRRQHEHRPRPHLGEERGHQLRPNHAAVAIESMTTTSGTARMASASAST